MFKSLFGTPPPAASRMTSLADSQLLQPRREVLTIAVRETMRRQGFPQHWVVPEALAVVSRHGDRGFQLRLVVREWQPPFLDYCVALQKAIRARVLRLDPLAPNWFMGILWKFDPVDEAAHPALPAHADFHPTQPMRREDLVEA